MTLSTVLYFVVAAVGTTALLSFTGLFDPFPADLPSIPAAKTADNTAENTKHYLISSIQHIWPESDHDTLPASSIFTVLRWVVCLGVLWALASLRTRKLVFFSSLFSSANPKRKGWDSVEKKVHGNIRGGQNPESYYPERQVARLTECAKRTEAYPPPYPNGWYKICNSDELACGEVKEVTCLGRKLALFRSNEDDGGKAHVLDAYCPHLGANMAIGGAVAPGGCLECPFHKWHFKGDDGSCVHIPYLKEKVCKDKKGKSKKAGIPSETEEENLNYVPTCKDEEYRFLPVPKWVKTKAWPVLEYHNMICIYFDADWVLQSDKKIQEEETKRTSANDAAINVSIEEDEQEPKQATFPPWTPPRFPEIENGEFVFRGKHTSLCRMHIIEIAENSADYQHFQPLHGQMKIPWTEITIPFLTINHSAELVSETKENGHIVHFIDHAHLDWKGKKVPRTEATAKISFIGPAGLMYFNFFTELGRIVLIMSHLPIEPFVQKVEFLWWAEPKVPRLIVWYVVGTWMAQWKQDMDIWESKTYRNKPLLVKGDGPIMHLRRWYSQFYSDSSRKVAYETNPLDW